MPSGRQIYLTSRSLPKIVGIASPSAYTLSLRIIADAGSAPDTLSLSINRNPEGEIMKNILLLVHDDAGQEARFQASLDVCRALGGHLACLDAAILPNVARDMYGATAMLLADERERESANRTKLEVRLAAEDVSWDWRDATGELALCLADAAGLADLIVINRSLDDAFGPDMRATAGQILANCDTPILAVPDTARSLNLSGHALIAWDGSDAATAALRAAIPLLKVAAKVTILEIHDGKMPSCGDDAAIYLSRHDISVEIVVSAPLNGDTAATLLAEIHDRRPDYVVMGGFGHSRMREALLGGVSRTLLSESPVPLILAR